METQDKNVSMTVALAELGTITDMADSTGPTLLVCNRHALRYILHALQNTYPEGDFYEYDIDAGDPEFHERMIQGVLDGSEGR